MSPHPDPLPRDTSEVQRQVLSRAARLLASAADFSDTLRQTLGACLPPLGDFGFFDVVHGDRVRRTAAAHEAPDIEALLAPTEWVRQERTDTNLCALSTGEPALHSETHDGWYRSIAANDDHLGLLRLLGFSSMITVPVRYRDELVGALTLFMGRSGRRHTQEDVAFASEIALLAAPVVVNARLVEQHRETEAALRTSEERLRMAVEAGQLGIRDATETPRVELLKAERRARAEAEAANHRLQLLAHAAAELSNSLDPDETLRAIATTIVPGIADWCRIDLLDEHGLLQRRVAYHTDPALAQKALDMAKSMQAAPTTAGSISWVIATGRSHYGSFLSPQARADPALKLYTETFQMRSHYILPLIARGRTIGAMGVVQAESGRELSEQDRSLILELGQRAALALDNARLYAEAAAVRRQAEAANRAKDEFLAMLGHELRNPLAPIATALELMARLEPGAAVEERRVIERQVAHLSRLIDDLLDVSRITQGKIQLHREVVDMRLVVGNAVELTRPVFERHWRPVELRLDAGRALVMGDSVRLTQVLCNLLVNAAKFTPKNGSVTLGLRREGAFVEASVQDTGAGIDAGLLPRVFDLFVQGRQAMDRQAGGLGLGLAIVRTLATMHGGEVTAESDGPGKGSRFVVKLPASDEAMAPEATTQPQAREPVGSGRILVVDDNADAAETLAELLRLEGYEVRQAGDAKGALALLENHVPQLALLDIGLPDIDGYQLAGLFRADQRAAGIKLIALTGYGQENDRARALAANFDEHLVKPVRIERLLEVLRQQLPRP